MADASKLLPGDTLRQGYPKINDSIDNANEALKRSFQAESNSNDATNIANSAVNTANNAVNTAGTAVTKANSVQEQFNQVVIEGDSSVEAAQARVDLKNNTFSTLKDRIDSEQRKIITISEKTGWVDPKEFGAIADGIIVDVVAIQAAIDSLKNKKGKVVFSKGLYYFGDKTVVLTPEHSGITFESDGAVLYTDKQSIMFDVVGTGFSSKLVFDIKLIKLKMYKTDNKATDVKDLLISRGGWKSADNYADNKNSIAVRSTYMYTALFEKLDIQGFGKAFHLNNESCRITWKDCNLTLNRIPIYGEKGAICNTLNILENDISFNIGWAIYVDTGAGININRNNIEGNYQILKSAISSQTNTINPTDKDGNTVLTSMYFNNTYKLSIDGNYFETGKMWYDPTAASEVTGQYSRATSLWTLEGIAKNTATIGNNYYNTSDRNTNNDSLQNSLGNVVPPNPFEADINNDRNISNIHSDNLVVNSRMTGKLWMKNTMSYSTATNDNESGTQLLYTAYTSGKQVAFAKDSIFNGYNVATADVTDSSIALNTFIVPVPAYFKSVNERAYSYGIWVKSPRIGTIGATTLSLGDSDPINGRGNQTQFNTKENEWQFVSGYRSFKGSNYQNDIQFNVLFFAPRFRVNSVTKTSGTQIEVKVDSNDISNGYVKIGDGITLSNGLTGTLASMVFDYNTATVSLILNGIYGTVGNCSWGRVSTYVEGNINVSYKAPMLTMHGNLLPATPNRMQRVEKETVRLKPGVTNIKFSDADTIKKSLINVQMRYTAITPVNLKVKIGQTGDMVAAIEANKSDVINLTPIYDVIRVTNSDVISYAGLPSDCDAELILTWVVMDQN